MDQKIIIMVVFVIICCCCFCCLSLSATSTAIVMAGGDTCEDYCDKDGTDTCEEDSDEEDDDDKYTCTCKAGYGGNKCETLICDTAAKADCNETGTTKQGTCIVSEPNAERYTCECEPGYSGEKCDTTLALKTVATCENKCANESLCVGNPLASSSADCTGVGQCSDPDGNEVTGVSGSEECEAEKHTWTANGVCSDASHTDEAACTAVAGNTWTVGACSDTQYATEAACTGATHTWSDAAVCSDAQHTDETACTGASETWTPAGCSDGETTDPDACVLVPHTWTTGTCTDGAITAQDACETSSVNTWTGQMTWSPAGYCRGPDGTKTEDLNKQTCLNRATPGSWIPDDKTASKTGLTGYCSGSTCTIDDCCESVTSTR